MDLNAFVEEHRPAWRKLEQLVSQLEAAGAKSLADLRGAPPPAAPPADAPSPDERDEKTLESARELAVLYRAACADLIRARSETANAELIGYLNGLVGRAYGVIYQGRRFRLVAFLRFVLVQIPRRVRARWGYILAATLFFLSGLAFGWIAETLDPSAKHYLLPGPYAEIEDRIEKSPATQNGNPLANSPIDSSQIMTNNIHVTFGAFAAGATAGIGTAGVLFYNGILLGDLAAIFARHGLSEGFWALILPHGVIELTAIMIAGAAGFLIARAIIAPGDMGRRAALAKYGLEAVELAIGCAILLVPAGLIEGFVTPQVAIPPAGKIGFGLLTGACLLVYFVWNEELLDQVGLLEVLRVRS